MKPKRTKKPRWQPKAVPTKKPSQSGKAVVARLRGRVKSPREFVADCCEAAALFARSFGTGHWEVARVVEATKEEHVDADRDADAARPKP